MLTFDTRWTNELIHKVHFQVRHIYALSVIPLITSTHLQSANIPKKWCPRKMGKENTPITSDHNPIFIIPSLTNAIQFIILLPFPPLNSCRLMFFVFLILDLDIIWYDATHR